MINQRVSLIILSFGQHELTIACLQSLIRLSSPVDTIIVCDNNSSAPTSQAILAWGTKQFGGDKVEVLDHGFENQAASQAQFVFIQNGANVGFAGGNNPGIRYALACGSDFIWLLNNDTTVHPDALRHLLHCAATEQAGIIGSTVVFDEDKAAVQCGGGCTYNPATTIFKPVMGGASLEEALNQDRQPGMDYIYGASLFVRAKIFAQCGLLNEEFFLFNEEIDLCTRAKRTGFAISWCRDSIVFHKVSQTVGRADSGDRKKIAFANYHENLSTLIFTKTFYPHLLPFTMAFRFLGKLAMLTKNSNWYLIWPLLDAYRDFLAGRNQREHYEHHPA